MYAFIMGLYPRGVLMLQTSCLPHAVCFCHGRSPPGQLHEFTGRCQNQSNPLTVKLLKIKQSNTLCQENTPGLKPQNQCLGTHLPVPAKTSTHKAGELYRQHQTLRHHFNPGQSPVAVINKENKLQLFSEVVPEIQNYEEGIPINLIIWLHNYIYYKL